MNKDDDGNKQTNKLWNTKGRIRGNESIFTSCRMPAVHAESEPPTETEAINGEWYLGVGELAPELLTDDDVDEADPGCTTTDLFGIGV